jgi:hypothetical protein
MQIAETVRYQQPDVYCRLRRRADRLTRFFEWLEKVLDPIVELLRRANR